MAVPPFPVLRCRHISVGGGLLTPFPRRLFSRLGGFLCRRDLRTDALPFATPIAGGCLGPPERNILSYTQYALPCLYQRRYPDPGCLVDTSQPDAARGRTGGRGRRCRRGRYLLEG